MSSPSVRIAGIALDVILCVLVRGLSPSAAQTPEPEPNQSKVKTFLKERLATLKEIAVLTAKAHQDGVVPIERVLEAEHAVLKAAIDLGITDKERIALLEKLVALARKQEEGAVAAVKKGISPTIAALKARASRLEFEIALERAKSK